MLTFQVKKAKWSFPRCLCFENTRNKLEAKSRPSIKVSTIRHAQNVKMLIDQNALTDWLTDWLTSAPQIDWSGAFRKWNRNAFIAQTFLPSPSSVQPNDTCIIGLMGYWLRRHEGERNNNCFSKIQPVAQKYRDKTTLASKTRFSRYRFGFQSRHFLLLVGFIQYSLRNKRFCAVQEQRMRNKSQRQREKWRK